MEPTASQDAAIVNTVCSNERELSELTAVDVAARSASDFVLSQIIEFVKFGWPSSIAALFQPYYHCRDELIVENGWLVQHHRTVIPVVFRPLLLEELHFSHLGITHMKAVLLVAQPRPRHRATGQRLSAVPGGGKVPTEGENASVDLSSAPI